MRYRDPAAHALLVGLVLAAGAATVLTTGCASPRASGGGQSGQPSLPASRSAMSLLTQRSAEEAAAPRPLEALPVPAGVPGTEVAPVDTAASLARRPLAESLPPLTPPAATPPTAGSAPEEALRLYARGRALLLDGKAAEASELLESAAKLDPGSPTILRELAESQLAQGRRASAIATLNRAVPMGLTEPRALSLLGREALRARRFEEALQYLGDAFRSPEQSPEQRAITGVDLAEALYELGYIAASRDALEDALVRPLTGIASQRSRADALEVLRRRADLWRRAGDVSCRLGEFDRAAACYQQSARSPSADPSAVIPRQVYATLRSGHRAEAALLVLRDIESSGGRVEDRHLPILRYLCEHTDQATLIADALDQMATGLPTASAPTVRSGLARAAAAVVPNADACRRLAAHLAQQPLDHAAATDFLTALSLQTPGKRAATLTSIIQDSPAATAALASALLARGQDTPAVLSALLEERNAGASLLAGVVITRMGDPVRALSVLGETPPAGAYRATWVTARAAAAFDAGRQDVLAQTRTLAEASMEKPTDRQAAAATAAFGSDAKGALDLLRPLLAPGTVPDTSVLLESANLELAQGNARNAEVLLQRAIEADRFDERAYEALFALYNTDGALHDAAKLTSTARSLRQAVPTSRVVRRLAAQELLSRSLWPQAEASLLGLMRPDWEDPEALDALTTVWERAAAASPELTARGEGWLRERLATRPFAPGLTGSLARVLVAASKPADAEELLRQFTDTLSIPDLRRLREWVLREGLDKPAEADALALARLDQAPPTPENVIEMAELLAATEKFDQAAALVGDRLPPGTRLTPAQIDRLVKLVSKLKPVELAKGKPEAAAGAVRLFDLVAGTGAPIPPAMHLARVMLLAAAYPEETSRLLDAVDDFAKRFPDARDATLVQTADTLLAREDPTAALLFLPAAADRAPKIANTLLTEWFRLTAARGDESDVRRLVRTCQPPTMLGLLQEQRPTAIDVPATEQAQRAEVSYQLGTELNTLERIPEALVAYRLALEFRPGHAWTSNNLGYLLLEQGKDLEESEQLIHAAYQQLADDYHVIDSLAWVRYKRGKFADVAGPDGSVAEPGAVSLLRRAAQLAKQEADQSGDVLDPTISDHLGDALWRVGDADGAKKAWLSSSDSSARMLDIFEPRFPDAAQAEPPDFLKKLRLDLQRVKRKLDEAASGAPPSVEPLAQP